MERDEAMDGTADAIAHFNSHAHVERDYFDCTKGVEMSISTHTLTWSVTDMAKHYTYHRRISTHTLTWSVTR